MFKPMFLSCLLLVSCSRIYVERRDISGQDKISLLKVNAAFKTKDFKGTSVCFLPIDLTLLDDCSKCLEIKNDIKINFENNWYKYIDRSINNRLKVYQQPGEANYIASIRIEKVRTQNPLTLLNPLGTHGKIITYTVRIVDKQNNEICFGMKGEWVYFAPVSLAFLAEDVSTKML
jgi:hypothetical protein